MSKKLIILPLMLVTLTACDQAPVVDVETSSENATTTIVESSGDYKTTAPLKPSPSSGVTNGTESSELGLDAMDYGLLQISKEYVETSDYFYQPGQVIGLDEAGYLLNREYTDAQFKQKVKNDPDAKNIGINPLLEDKQDPGEAPIYVNTLVEQDYYKYNEAGDVVIDTIAIGLGMDSTYEYTFGGEDKSKTIDNDELTQYATTYVANRMTQYIRSIEGMESVNIIYGFYHQIDSEVVPGNFIAKGYVAGDSESMDVYELIDEENIVLPSERGAEINDALNTQIINLQASIYSYFSNSSGTYSYVHYKDGALESIDIKIIADIYTKVEAEPFFNYIKASIKPILDYGVPVVVEVTRSNGDPVGIIQVDNNKNVSQYIY